MLEKNLPDEWTYFNNVNFNKVKKQVKTAVEIELLSAKIDEIDKKIKLLETIIYSKEEAKNG